MKLTFSYCTYILAILLMAGCKDTVDLPAQPLSDFEKIYMPQAVNNPVRRVLNIADTPQSIIFGANYGGQDYPAQDISFNFTIDPKEVTAYNQKNGTAYTILPAASYTITATAGLIKKGTLSTAPLEIKVHTSGANAMNVLTDYLLPVSITENKSSIKVNEDLRTTYFIVRSQPNLDDYPEYSRTLWSIAGFSSEEPAEAQWGNGGQALHTLDGKQGTFWHSQWQGGSPGPPHFITVNMGETKVLHGLWFIARQSDNDGKPKEVQVQISTDGASWTDAGAFTLEKNKSKQKQFLSGFKTARYFKVIFKSAYDASYCHLAELGAF